MIIYPAIDIISGQCVRLTKGDYSTKKVYHNNPLDRAKQFEEEGFKHIHLVDLDAAKGNGDNLNIIEQIVSKTSLQVQLGGGIRNNAILVKVFDYGVQKAIIGSIAVKQPNLVFDWIVKYGSDSIVIGADVRFGLITTEGWHETSDYKVIDFIKMYRAKGAMQFLCTDVSKDGMMKGISIDLYQKIIEECSEVQLIGSGGVSNIKDVEIAKDKGLFGIVIGKALYENKILNEDLIKLIQ